FKVDAEAHPCGAIELHYVAEVVQDVANPEWLVDVFDEEVPMTMDSDFAFDPFVPFNMNVSQGDELHYTWYTGGWESWQDMGPEWAGDMDVVVIPAGETVSLDFVFDATLGVPVGSEVDFFLSMTLWRDVTTDQMVFDYMFGDTPWMVAVFD
ncbi:hypothetical protein HOI83_03160, partial [Candidatus Uhrbacteria bacterium]|nr:hypothetical protein [Candidatus Uhrbacteria bacterium]